MGGDFFGEPSNPDPKPEEEPASPGDDKDDSKKGKGSSTSETFDLDQPLGQIVHEVNKDELLSQINF